MELEVFVTPGLGDNTYLLASRGEAVLVDPQRDVGRFLDRSRRRGWNLMLVLETHVHNDYVSGAREAQAASGAEIGAPAKGVYQFPHRALKEGDELRIGGLRLVAMETPGHTPEHLSYLVYEEGGAEPAAVFSGGSLIVGAAGRTDLLGEQMTEELTKAQFRSLRRLAALPDNTRVLPTHGAGSFCASGTPSTGTTSVVADERRGNPALSTADEKTFLSRQLSGLLAYPTYYRDMGPINRAGPKVTGGIASPAGLSAQEVDRRMRAGARVVDGRDRVSFAAAHLPGSVNIELGSDFASYVGWVLPFNAPTLLVVPYPEEEAALDAATQLYRVGYERIVGFLKGGLEGWRSGGYPTSSYPVADIRDLPHPRIPGSSVRVVDVRQRPEWDAGHIPGSMHVMVGDIPHRLSEMTGDQEVWAVCASGHRASVAASLLDGSGIPVRLVARGGVPEWLRAVREGLGP